MAGLVPATHVFLAAVPKQDVGARHRAGHDTEQFDGAIRLRPAAQRGVRAANALQLAGSRQSGQIAEKTAIGRRSGQIPFLNDECGLRTGDIQWLSAFECSAGGAKVDIDVVNRFRNLPVANVSDAMNRMNAGGAMLRPMHAGGVLAGAAVTVKTRPGDNLMMHKAFDIAAPGDVIVVDAGGDVTNAIIGENAAAYAESLGLAGVVINGAIRDSAAIAARKFPIFAIGITHRGPYKDGPGEVNVPISIDGMVIVPGDLMLGDGDGVVCVPRERVEEVYAAALAKHQKDEEDARAVTERKVKREWVDAKLRELGCEFLTHRG